MIQVKTAEIHWYGFYYSEGGFLLGVNTDRKTIKKELDLYRKEDPEEYNYDDFVSYLLHRGYTVKDIPEREGNEIYF